MHLTTTHGEATCSFELSAPLDNLIRLAAQHEVTVREVVATALRAVVDRLSASGQSPAPESGAQPSEGKSFQDLLAVAESLVVQSPSTGSEVSGCLAPQNA